MSDFTPEQLERAAALAKHLPVIAARMQLLPFVRYNQPDFDLQPFHEVYYTLLEMFARGRIKRLIITMPPRHGKSQGSSRMLPAYMLGLNPRQHIAIGSYAATLARDFNRDVQRIMEADAYGCVFPDTVIPADNNRSVSTAWLRNADIVEVIGAGGGGLRVVGRGGGLSGKTVDVAILDDIYKDAAEGNSPIIREAAFRWYTSVVRKRMPKQQLIVFTRWHEDDLIGHLERTETVITVSKWADLETIPPGAWVKLNFEAIKSGAPTELDPREPGQALWPSRYSLEDLLADKALDPVMFECLNQGNPSSAAGRLYSGFETYGTTEGAGVVVGKGNYTDTADTGDDYLCSISYDKVRVGLDEKRAPLYKLYVTDVVYTQKPMEVTEQLVPAMYERAGTRYAFIESNNGGRGFARAVQRAVPRVAVSAFAQTNNKESRILTNATQVQRSVVMPVDWAERWPVFADHVTRYLRNYAGNMYHDAPDALTGMVEKDIFGPGLQGGVMRRN